MKTLRKINILEIGIRGGMNLNCEENNISKKISVI